MVPARTYTRIIGAALAAIALLILSPGASRSVQEAETAFSGPAAAGASAQVAALSAAATSTITFTVVLPGDLNGDGHVTRTDLDMLAARYHMKDDDPNWNQALDLVPDGQINLLDLYDVASRAGSN